MHLLHLTRYLSESLSSLSLSLLPEASVGTETQISQYDVILKYFLTDFLTRCCPARRSPRRSTLPSCRDCPGWPHCARHPPTSSNPFSCWLHWINITGVRFVWMECLCVCNEEMKSCGCDPSCVCQSLKASADDTMRLMWPQGPGQQEARSEARGSFPPLLFLLSVSASWLTSPTWGCNNTMATASSYRITYTSCIRYLTWFLHYKPKRNIILCTLFPLSVKLTFLMEVIWSSCLVMNSRMGFSQIHDMLSNAPDCQDDDDTNSDRWHSLHFLFLSWLLMRLSVDSADREPPRPVCCHSRESWES